MEYARVIKDNRIVGDPDFHIAYNHTHCGCIHPEMYDNLIKEHLENEESFWTDEKTAILVAVLKNNPVIKIK